MARIRACRGRTTSTLASVFGAARRVDGEYEAEQVIEGVGNARIGQLVARSPALGDRDDEAATTQTRQVIRHDLPRDADLLGKFRRKGPCAAQAQQDLRPGGVGECISESSERIVVNKRLHRTD